VTSGVSTVTLASISRALGPGRLAPLVSCAALLAGALCQAADAPKLYGAPQAQASAPVVGAGGLMQVMLSLLLVLAAVFAAAWLMRRLRGFPRRGAQAISVLADVALGAKERAVLLQVGKDQVLVGVAPGQVNTLHVLSEPISAGQLVAGVGLSSPGSSPAPGADPQAPSFKSLFKQGLGFK
jgi:flagellar protein FliO/FliZ